MAERGELREMHYGALKEYDKSSQLALSEFNEAKQALREIASRVLRGENITLVCFEEDGKHCHRHYLLERIEDEIDDQSESDFSFVIPKV